MSFKILGKNKDDPILVLVLENDFILRIPVKDVAESGWERLADILETEINRIIRETAISERESIQQGIKDLLGIKGSGRQG
ncbi:MAG: hypothetical protein PHT96_14365 [Syntrophorhabdaceae bacterium]|nr:hypothetical protein [Syntrophorhabdaceae bacterium]